MGHWNRWDVGMLAVLLVSSLLSAAIPAGAGDPPIPELEISGLLPLQPQVPVEVVVKFVAQGNAITAIAFSVDLGPDLVFDESDLDMDGIPDAVIFPLGLAELTSVFYDPGDADGELDVLMANLSGFPLPQGQLVSIQLTPDVEGLLLYHIDFSTEPLASFGDASGQGVAGTALVTGAALFSDGFESGDLSRWSSFRPSSLGGVATGLER